MKFCSFPGFFHILAKSPGVPTAFHSRPWPPVPIIWSEGESTTYCPRTIGADPLVRQRDFGGMPAKGCGDYSRRKPGGKLAKWRELPAKWREMPAKWREVARSGAKWREVARRGCEVAAKWLRSGDFSWRASGGSGGKSTTYCPRNITRTQTVDSIFRGSTTRPK